MENVDVASSQGNDVANIANVDVSSSVSDLPPSGGLTGADSQIKGKLSEDEIIASFNKPNTQEVKQEVKSGIQQKEEVVAEPTEEEKAAQAQKELDEAQAAEEMTPEEDISISKINQYIKEIPELKAAFDKNPAVRNSFYAMARRSSRLSEYQAIIPSPEAAKFAAQNSEAMVQLNDSFFSEDPQENGQFWQSLYDNSLLKDPVTGEVVVGQNGQPVSTGAYERVTQAYRQALYADLELMAGSIPDAAQSQKVKEAIQLIGEITGDVKKTPQYQQQQQKELPDDVKQRLSNADKLEQQLKQHQESQKTDFAKSVSSTIVSTITEDIGGHVKRMVEQQNIALTAYEQKNVVSDIFKELDRLASENRQYQLHFDSLSKRAPLTEAGRKSLVTEARKFAKDNLPSVALKVIREATSSTVAKAGEADAKRAAQASKKEVKTSGGAPNPGNSQQTVKEKAIAMQKQLGRKLTHDEIMAL